MVNIPGSGVPEHSNLTIAVADHEEVTINAAGGAVTVLRVMAAAKVCMAGAPDAVNCSN